MDQLWYWLALLAYSAAVIYLGYRAWLKTRAAGQSDEAQLEFWMARRQLPGWRLGVSLTSGWLMLGWIGFGMSQVYLYGATGLWILPIPWLILCVIIILMVPYVRRIGAVSLPQAIEKRYGPGARVLLAVFSFYVFLSWTQAELFMAGRLMQPFLGIPHWACMLMVVVPVIAYTALGGFRAIVTTDLVQFLVMAAFMIILAVAAWTAASTAADGHVWDAIRQSEPPWSGAGQALNPFFLGVLFPVILLVGYLPGWMIEQDLVLRIQAARSTREARKGAVLALALIGVFVIGLPTLAAFCALVALPPANGAAAAEVGDGALAIIPALIDRLPLALAVLMFVGLVACQMSTVDTFSNVTAIAASYDVLDPILVRRRATGTVRLGWARAISIAVIVFAMLLALMSESLGDIYYLSSGVLSACVAVPAMLMFWRRSTTAGAIAASIVGFVGTLGTYLYEYRVLQATDAEAPHYYATELPSWLVGSYGYHYIAAGVALAVLTHVAVSLLSPRPAPGQVGAVRGAPIDDPREFELAVSRVLEPVPAGEPDRDDPAERA